MELLQSLEKEIPPEKIKEKANRHEGRTSGPPAEIPVALLLEMDAEYREKAAAGKLKKIAPKKLNPGGKAWLPLLAAERTGYRFTLMFSNTALAHELGKTNDWVVIYYEKGKGEGQCTVVSEKKGGLKGKRVVRGREEECLRYYGQRAGGKP